MPQKKTDQEIVDDVTNDDNNIIYENRGSCTGPVQMLARANAW